MIVRDEAAATRLSAELRRGDDPFLDRRRKVAGLQLLAVASMGVISLYQLGIIPHLPEPPIPGLSADAVDASPAAYKILSTPDGVLGLASYATTLALAAAGGKNRVIETPWLPLALAAKVAFDTAQAARLTLDQATKEKAFCSYCLIAAGATFATLPHVLPEARAAWRRVTSRG